MFSEKIKGGLIALYIYLLVTFLGYILEKTIFKSIGVLMGGTLWVLGMLSGTPYGYFNELNYLAFIFGGLIWFIIGFFFALINKKTRGLKENMSLVGKFLMIAGAILFFIFIIASFFLSATSNDCFGPYANSTLFPCMLSFLIFFEIIYFCPFFLGIIFWFFSNVGL